MRQPDSFSNVTNPHQDASGFGAQEQEPQVAQFLAAWFGVRRRAQEINTDHASRQRVNTTEFILLRFIGEAAGPDEQTISALAGRIGVDPATVVRAVDSLERRGLALRRRDTRDRRKVFVEFTAAGRQAHEQAEQQSRQRLAAAFSAMSAAGRAALVRGLTEFVALDLATIDTPTDPDAPYPQGKLADRS